MVLVREEIMRILADKYYYFLKRVPFDDELYMKGMSEARNKFLANLHIAILKEKMPTTYNDWRYSTDYVTEKALNLLKKRQWNEHELVYEHMVPKARYIKKPCEIAARQGTLTSDFIYGLLINYFWTATIHKNENAQLGRTKMPTDWDQKNIFARYDATGIALIKHDKRYFKE